jgi:hypothetical protein
MQLNEYPKAIAKLQRRLLNLDHLVIEVQETIAILSNSIEREIINDATLTNDAKRKAKRLELQQSDTDHWKASNELRATQRQRDTLDIELQQLRNEFSVLKLEERRAIATIELHASSAAA